MANLRDLERRLARFEAASWPERNPEVREVLSAVDQDPEVAEKKAKAAEACQRWEEWEKTGGPFPLTSEDQAKVLAARPAWFRTARRIAAKREVPWEQVEQELLPRDPAAFFIPPPIVQALSDPRFCAFLERLASAKRGS